MADPRFFKVAGPLSLARIAQVAGAEIAGNAVPAEREFKDVAPLETAGTDEVSFIDNPKYLDAFSHSGAGACIVAPQHAHRAPDGMTLLLTDKPYRSYALVAQAFYPPTPADACVHPSAVVEPSAEIGPGCAIGPGAVVGDRVRLGSGCRVGANAVLGVGVEIGEGSVVGSGAVLSHCIIGKGCLLHPGVCIGNRGFGFAMDPEGFVEVPQLGRVIIGDDVEIGANSTVDRGSGPDTVIGSGSRIDNLVQIGHNVRIGKHCVIVAQAGISGSTKLEDFVVIAAKGGIAGHLTIGAGAQIGAKAGVMRDVGPGEKVLGSPAVSSKEFFRQVATLQRLAKGKRK